MVLVGGEFESIKELLQHIEYCTAAAVMLPRGEIEMKYRVNVTLEGYIEVDADSEKESIERTEEGFSLAEFYCEDSDVFEAELIGER